MIYSYPEAPCYVCALAHPKAKNVRMVGKVPICENCARVHLPRTFSNVRVTLDGKKLTSMDEKKLTGWENAKLPRWDGVA